MARTAFLALALAAIAYVVVFVPVGRHTLYVHATRILATPEAQELREGMSGVVVQAKRKVVHEALARSR